MKLGRHCVKHAIECLKDWARPRAELAATIRNVTPVASSRLNYMKWPFSETYVGLFGESDGERCGLYSG
jgi:hypothetical protein